MSKTVRSLISVLLSFLALSAAGQLYGQSGIYDRVGIIPGHGSFGSLPEENIDLFTGNVTLRYRDIYLPGPNGLDVEVWRVYNSKILKDRQSGNPVVQAYHQSWVGMGWTIHMGMIHNYSSSTPVLEFPDGRLETAYPNNYGLGSNIYLTRDFLKLDKTYSFPDGIYPRLYFKNGIVWVFKVTGQIARADGTQETVWLVTNICSPYGHHIDIVYDPDPNLPGRFLPTIQTITDSTGRVVTFETTGTPKKLTQIRVTDGNGDDRIFNYSVGNYANGYHRLDSFTPPMLPATTFEYLDGASSRYELVRMTTSYGGVLEYSYTDHTFDFNAISLDSRVVSEKRIIFNPGEEDPATWSFTYPTYQGAATGTVEVNGPVYDTNVTYNAYSASTPWKIGLIASRAGGDNSYSEACDWTYQQISTAYWTVLGINMGTAKGPLASTVIAERTGDAATKTDHYYDRTEVKRYGLPTRICSYLGPDGPLKSTTFLTYFYEAHTGFKGRHMLDFVSHEEVNGGQGSLNKTDTTYYEETGKWGALKQVKRWKQGTTYLTWDFTYQCISPESVIINVDPPGPGEGETIDFRYGIKGREDAPDFTRLDRTINPLDSSITREKRQDDGTMGYHYDNLGRVTSIDLMEDFNDIAYDWRPDGQNRVVVAQGGNFVTKFWDGMGRDTGSTETGDDVTLDSQKTLDAEGRVITESKASIHPHPNHVYSYLYNAAGQVTRITDPLGYATTIAYAGTTKTVTDPEDHATIYEYGDLPGLPTRVTDALGHAAVYEYDACGRLTSVDFNETRHHSYTYDGLDNVLTETHPETGLISYEYDSRNLPYHKTWGGTTLSFLYDTSKRLYETTATPGGDIVNYYYSVDTGRLDSIVDITTGWRRDNICYNLYGKLTSERVTIPGLAPKTLTYSYDGNLNPTGWKEAAHGAGGAVIANNALNMPASVSFDPNGQGACALVSDVAYGPIKMPAAITFGNGTSYSAAYNDAGMPSSVALMRGGTTLYDASYTYDDAGNILGITSTAPALTATFGYDALNRLTSAAYSSGQHATYTYEYDEYGNMLHVRENGGLVFDKDYSAQNRVQDFSYDSRGNLLSSNNGKLYYWDAQNRLRYIQTSAGAVIGKYLYDDRGLRLSALPPLPEINIKHEAVDIPSGGEAYLSVAMGQTVEDTLTIQNLGDANLEIGTLELSDYANFGFSQPASPIIPLGNTTFTIRFHPQTPGPKEATLTIHSNDIDEAEYVINLFGNDEPEIEIPQARDGGEFDFGELTIGEYVDQTFTIRNLGDRDLLLYGSPILVIDGPNAEQFSIVSEPLSPVVPGGSRTFIIRFTAAEGLCTAYLSIANNDWNENPYDITLTGTGVTGLNKVDDKTAFAVTSPAEGEELVPGAVHLITWTGAEEAKEVKIEYSADNGTTFQTIVERTANTGSYPWLVPPVMSGLCLVRISNVDGAAAEGETLSLEFKLKISASKSETEAPGLSVRVSIPDLKTVTSWTADVAFAAEGPSGVPGLSLNSARADRAETGAFLDRWHTVGLVIRPGTLTGTLFLDGKPLLDGVPLVQSAWAGASPDIIVRCAGAASIRVEDLEARYKDSVLRPVTEGEDVSQALVKDSFEGYPTGVFPDQGGWRAPGAQTLGLVQDSQLESGQSAAVLPSTSNRKTNSREGGVSLAVGTEEANRQADQAQIGSESAVAGVKAIVDEADSVTGLKSFRIETDGKDEVVVAKRLSLPSRVPFGVSEGNFVIGVAKTASQVRAISRSRLLEELGLEDRSDRSRKEYDRVSRRKSETANEEQVPGIAKAGRAPSGSGDKTMKLMSASPVGNFYIYSFDGKLLQMYDVFGALLKDYIYMGNRLVAEYDHVGARFLYYTPDQINSTRVVTDGSGTIVYSAAHDPYGGIQQTWVSTYDPLQKFSGKERDAESGLDYFGARYYDKSQYRFISADPMLTEGMARHDPKSWNLYSYCGNNPLVYVDSTGLYSTAIHYNVTYALAKLAGFTPGEAKRIATACAAVDTSPYSNSRSTSWSKIFVHFPDSTLESIARMNATNAANLEELGFNLHIIQDSFSHGGYAIWAPVPGPFGIITFSWVEVGADTHWYLTFLSGLKLCYDPDDPRACPARYDAMVRATFFALVFYRANNIRFHNDVTYQVPGH